jgi:hypothetical protein
MKNAFSFSVFLVSCFLLSLPAQADEPKGVPPLKVVYFTPADRTPDPERQERVGRVMKHIQEFYRKGMEANGHGQKTFALEWETPEKLRLHDIKGERKLTDYPKGTEGVVYNEVGRTLREKGIDIRNEHVLILGAWIDWNGNVATEYGPYAGAGDHSSGVAFACVDKLVDADLLSSKEPGGYHYMMPGGHCSLGMYNTLYIGGIAHELGHAFGVPHDSQRDAEKDTHGISLMGIGNHYYGKASRGEGRDAFITAASALHLSVCRAFDPDFEKNPINGQGALNDFEASFHDGKLILTGKWKGTPTPHGIIVYNDNLHERGDYDAKTWVVVPDKDGNFRFEIDELERVPYEMEFAIILPGGRKASISLNYSNTSGTPTIESIYTSFARNEINTRLDQRDWDTVAHILKTLIEKVPDNNILSRKLKHLETLKNPPPAIEPDKVPDEIKKVDITFAAALEAWVGWLEPSRGILRESGFMEVGDAFYESGIYAHADSRYVFSLGKKWKEFDFEYGIQNGKSGSVVFVVRGDGKELFRSETVRSRAVHRKKLDVSGVDRLELTTETAGDGRTYDWGLWLNPQLSR